jgi:DNA polymerase I
VKFKRTKCNCKECPLDGQKKVLGLCGIEKPKVAFIGDMPWTDDILKGEPFSGAAGARLKDATAQAGLTWHTVHRTNLLLCKNSDRYMDSVEVTLALECCKPGFEEELEFLKKQGVQVLVPLGPEPLLALGLEGKIGKMRGSVYQIGKQVAVPTYHPAFILKGMWKEEPTWIGDLQKVRELSLKKWAPPKENFNLFPTVKEVKTFVRDSIHRNILVGVDIETTSLSPEYSRILMIGLASSPEDVLVVPFLKQGGLPYWKEGESKQVWSLLRELMTHGRLVFQNAPFDTWHLERHGFPVGNVAEDTMLLHHVINPELPHNLGYIVSVYGQTPYWKDVVLGNADKMIAMDDKEVRTYNARDCAVLLQVLPEMHKHLKEVGTERTYREVSLKLIRPLRKMSNKGLPIDPMLVQKKKRQFERERRKAFESLMEYAALPEGFNLNSGDHLRLLIWGIEPKSAAKVRAEKLKIDNNPKGRKDTKKYKELLAKLDVYDNTKPLYKTDARPRKTDGGSEAVDSEALISIERSALRRLEAIDGILKKKDKHIQEQEDIRILIAFLHEYRKYADADKLASTFTGFPVWKDGRVHPSYKIHGTATGRLSSSDPNAQNIPGEVQDVFVAPEGYVIIKADYSNIELRMLAYIAGEKVLIDAFEKGQNIHDLNCKLLFGIDESNPIWKTARRAAKVFVFGRSYGGSVEGIYKQLIVAVPELGLTLEHFKKMDRKYFEALPAYSSWVKRMQATARNTRCVETAFGRKRFLLGTPDEIERMALNTPIQGSASEVTLTALIELDAALEAKFPKAVMIATVHDSILVEAPEEQATKIAKLMKSIMQKEYLIEGRKVRFPVDIEVGRSWGTTEPLEV